MQMHSYLIYWFFHNIYAGKFSFFRPDTSNNGFNIYLYLWHDSILSTSIRVVHRYTGIWTVEYIIIKINGNLRLYEKERHGSNVTPPKTKFSRKKSLITIQCSKKKNYCIVKHCWKIVYIWVGECENLRSDCREMACRSEYEIHWVLYYILRHCILLSVNIKLIQI